jgi:hypothetical protein
MIAMFKTRSWTSSFSLQLNSLQLNSLQAVHTMDIYGFGCLKQMNKSLSRVAQLKWVFALTTFRTADTSRTAIINQLLRCKIVRHPTFRVSVSGVPYMNAAIARQTICRQQLCGLSNVC